MARSGVNAAPATCKAAPGNARWCPDTPGERVRLALQGVRSSLPLKANECRTCAAFHKDQDDFSQIGEDQAKLLSS